jgi:L-histidine Nalpha-methyltransferase
MPATVPVTVHASQSPENIRRGLLAGLRARRIAPKYLYESRHQAQKWLALHEAFSPARTDPDAIAIYDRSFAAAVEMLRARRVRVIGLGCGGGQKEASLLALLAKKGRALSYTPCDASLPLVLASTRAAEAAAPGITCHALLCDLSTADDLPAVLDQLEPRNAPRLYTFFGIIPNFEPDDILPRLSALLHPDDLLLFSANLSPGPDYAAGVERIFPGYNNPETRAWLLAFIRDIGIDPSDGVLEFSIEEAPGLRRIAADFRFLQNGTLTVESDHFDFAKGENLRLFFSYRYTPDRVGQLLRSGQIEVVNQWITQSEEEGIFLCRRIPVELYSEERLAEFCRNNRTR